MSPCAQYQSKGGHGGAQASGVWTLDPDILSFQPLDVDLLLPFLASPSSDEHVVSLDLMAPSLKAAGLEGMSGRHVSHDFFFF